MKTLSTLTIAAALAASLASGSALAQTKPAGDAGTNKQMTFEQLSAMSETDQASTMKTMSDADRTTVLNNCSGREGMSKTLSDYCSQYSSK
jgi:hypothetical protein